MSKDFQRGAVGAAIKLEVYEDGALLDISSATSLSMIFESPPDDDGEVRIYTRTATLPGSTGVLQYTTVAGDEILSQAGTWKVQGQFTLSGFTGQTTIEKFKVTENLWPPDGWDE